ncbi:hypothetical protein G7K_6660-t1 [Saitoella complicata NRRL Y-17804]|uniref:Class I unconventional myosin n=1 Tax=Saitoella complicata (strain BCRC 22490 / CBS 7301 / JCM 7358 / NBRC 10748 / NRRL Y-17804) TaxID=698492 RepID=A0A0E9NRT7_SAICN|nr:hypothetical protein G7K_6660-t1 [Saitoella complicata NRRL Y-17804]
MGVTKRANRNKGASAATKSSGAQQQGGVKRAVYESTKKREVGVSDLTLLSKISNEAINENLKKRFEHGDIYTYIGHVLISVNPFRDLGIYTENVLASYRGKNRLEMPPHVYAIAESAYYNMNSYKENQCIIISGESGAGKTEAAKRIMQYIANVSGSGSSSIQEVKDMVLATNPLLESFGCAKTLRNNNSSRHGKYLEIQFNTSGEPVGANITNYLLEKNRVVGQIENERNFHIFYQFTKSADARQREMFGLQGPESYVYTSRSNCFSAPGIDDSKDFADTLAAMRTIGLTQAEQDEIFRMLAIILWLGNVQFVEDHDGNAAIADESVPNFVAYLMDVDASAVIKALTIRVMETSRGGRRGSVYDVPLNPTQATAVRDALSKAIYNNLFEWIVSRVNISMTARSQTAYTIGILDIYGFEIFEQNSFEQLCINYVNEKLQQIFIELTLKTEQEEYVREQIKWTPIDYFNNKIVCDLIEEKRPPGIFAALNDAVATAHADSGAADSSFVQRLGFLSSNPHFESRQGHFLVKHYAGDVMYTVSGMTDKNKDALLKDLLDLVAVSGNPFLGTIFPDRVDRDSKKRPPTAGDKIKASANDLVQTLMRARPSYIRTIKPNENKSPTEYNEKNVVHQIKYLGLQENVRIRRAGFAYRQTFEKFVERFYLLSPRCSYAGDYTWTGDMKSGTLQILKDTGIPAEEYQMGTTKAFIKTPETLFALEHMRDRYWHNMATRIQRAWRNFLRYRNECAIRIQRMWMRNKINLQYIQMRDEGHRTLAGRKERRRMSLLGSRRFLGDYLGVGMKGGYGEVIARSAGVAGENVQFSCKAEVLVSKLGRSSKPSPRMLVLTDKAVYIIIQAVVNGQLQISTERQIRLGEIKYVGMTNLRDDWMSFGIGSPQLPDPLISCVFKTEFCTRLRIVHRGVDIRVGPAIEYSKKPGKFATVKAQKDPQVPRDDVYKSGTIHVPQGEPANSVSHPTPPKKAGIVRPITTGKLLKPSQPRNMQAVARSKPASTPAHRQPAATTAPVTLAQPAASMASVGRTAPPPPPPPPAAVEEPQAPIYKGLYDFNGQSASELSFKKDEVLDIVQKGETGWWLARKDGRDGWVPQSYVKEEMPPPRVRAVAPPPPPPASVAAPRAAATANPVLASLGAPVANGGAQAPMPIPGMAGAGPNGLRKTSPLPGATNGAPKPPATRPAGVASGKAPMPAPPKARPNSSRPAAPAAPPRPGASAGTSGTGTPVVPGRPGQNMAGSLADALRARAQASNGRDHEEEDDDW